jgi:hypothetical protein
VYGKKPFTLNDIFSMLLTLDFSTVTRTIGTSRFFEGAFFETKNNVGANTGGAW